jgi:hypothetical protein
MHRDRCLAVEIGGQAERSNVEAEFSKTSDPYRVEFEYGIADPMRQTPLHGAYHDLGRYPSKRGAPTMAMVNAVSCPLPHVGAARIIDLANVTMNRGKQVRASCRQESYVTDQGAAFDSHQVDRVGAVELINIELIAANGKAPFSLLNAHAIAKPKCLLQYGVRPGTNALENVNHDRLQQSCGES